MLRLLVYGVPGTPIFELSERLSEFHDIDFLVIERSGEDGKSYFDDKIPEVKLDMGDLTSGSASQHMARDPGALARDKELTVEPDFGNEEYEGLDDKEIGVVFRIQQGVVVTEIPDMNLVRWATHVCFLSAEETGVVKWFSNRRFCPTCKNVHHLEDKPPKFPDVCDRCGTDLIIQNVDQAENIKKQFKNWRNDFWRFQKVSEDSTDYRLFSIDKMNSFDDLVGRVDLWIRDQVDKNDWYSQAKDDLKVKGVNPFSGPFKWNPMTKTLEPSQKKK